MIRAAALGFFPSRRRWLLCLWIEVKKAGCAGPRGGETRGQIHGGGGFSHSAF